MKTNTEYHIFPPKLLTLLVEIPVNTRKITQRIIPKPIPPEIMTLRIGSSAWRQNSNKEGKINSDLKFSVPSTLETKRWRSLVETERSLWKVTSKHTHPRTKQKTRPFPSPNYSEDLRDKCKNRLGPADCLLPKSSTMFQGCYYDYAQPFIRGYHLAYPKSVAVKRGTITSKNIDEMWSFAQWYKVVVPIFTHYYFCILITYVL